MKTWEYRVVEGMCEDSFKEVDTSGEIGIWKISALDALGSDGWELVAYSEAPNANRPGSSLFRAALKRETE